MNKEQKESLVKNFYQIAKELMRMDARPVVFELALLLFGQKKMFDNERLFHEKATVRKKITAWLMNHFQNEKDYHMETVGRFFCVVRKKNLKLLDEYKRSKSDFEEAGRIYGVLMGFPRSATNAWYLNGGIDDGDRVHLLNSYEHALLEEVLGDITLRGFVFSRKSWQSEYRFQIREHVRIYEMFPEIFLVGIQGNQDNLVYYNRVKLHLKKGNLLVKFSPLERFMFESIQGKGGDWRSRHNITYEFINMRKAAYKTLKE